MVTVNLKAFDVILVNSSGGKDSQTMLHEVVRMATEADVLHRVVVVHSDLGRVEWKGTRELAEDQARRHGVRFIAVKRPQGDLLEHVEDRGKWPSSTTRYCTSDHKRGQVARVVTSLTREVVAMARAGRWPGPERARQLRGGARVTILNCLGFRAEESPARAKRVAFGTDERLSNGRRDVYTWLPIHDWTEAQVWASIRASGLPYHRAYDLGMPRLSCVFCIFSPREALLLAGEHNRALLDEYVRVEKKIGHTFTSKLPIVEIRDALDRGERADTDKIKSWCM